MGDLSEMKTYADCQGCSLCLLPCPMWRQARDVMFSPQGIAKAMQSGAKAEDLHEPLSHCIQCGACDVMCPENIDLSQMLKKMQETIGLSENLTEESTLLSPFMMSCAEQVQAQIGADDLYIIDAAPFHAHYAERVIHYDALRKQTGCAMNLDLNRMAIPTGISSYAANSGQFNVQEQLTWLLEGRDFKRVVVENHADIMILQEITGKEVLSVKDLMGNTMGKVAYAAS